jgi:hypothetical protein
LRRVLDRAIGLTRLRVTRDFYGVRATYDALICDEPLQRTPATVTIPLELRGEVIGSVTVQDSRRAFFDADADASARRIVAAHADAFEDPSARVRAQNARTGRRRGDDRDAIHGRHR